MYVIRNRFTNVALYTSDTATSLAEALSEVLARHRAWRYGEGDGSRANLAGADLAGADLAGANLAGADLAGANLARADLAGANLAGADLADANLARADLAGANLARANLAGADLADANLARADLAGANLAGANLADANLADAINLPGGVDKTDPPEPYVRQEPTREVLAERARRYRERHPNVPVVENLDARILDAVTVKGGVLDMSQWHGSGGVCGTTHCRAGWAIHFAGPAGAALERECGSQQAGAMIYRASTGRVPHFFATDERAMEDIERCAAEQTASTEGA
jgi:hypothetical protein